MLNGKSSGSNTWRYVGTIYFWPYELWGYSLKKKGLKNWPKIYGRYCTSNQSDPGMAIEVLSIHWLFIGYSLAIHRWIGNVSLKLSASRGPSRFVSDQVLELLAEHLLQALEPWDCAAIVPWRCRAKNNHGLPSGKLT